MSEPAGSASRVEPLVLRSGPFRLAATIHLPRGDPRGSIAIGHPHPGHGGNRDHSVVVAVAERAAALGLAAVRFDVRGVRDSDGDVTDRAGHLEDLRAAAAAAASWAPGLPALGAGFSYGARLWMEAMLLPDAPRVVGLLLLAPSTRVPKGSKDFGDLLLGRPIRDAAIDRDAHDRLARIPVPARILVGANDDVAPPEELRAHAARGVVVTALTGLNHFFSRSVGAGPAALDVLVPAIDAALEALLSSAI